MPEVPQNEVEKLMSSFQYGLNDVGFIISRHLTPDFAINLGISYENFIDMFLQAINLGKLSPQQMTQISLAMKPVLQKEMDIRNALRDVKGIHLLDK